MERLVVLAADMAKTWHGVMELYNSKTNAKRKELSEKDENRSTSTKVTTQTQTFLLLSKSRLAPVSDSSPDKMKLIFDVVPACFFTPV